MEERLQKIILEKFESKKQQRYFFAKCNDDSLPKKEKTKWCKMADEFAKDTNFKKLPEKVKEKNIEEIVDFDGSIPSSKIPKNVRSKNTTARKTSDFQQQATSQPPFQSGHYMKRYWGESENIEEGINDFSPLSYAQKIVSGKMSILDAMKETGYPFVMLAKLAKQLKKDYKFNPEELEEAEMDDALGFEETMGDNSTYEEAMEYFVKELGFDEESAKERLTKMGYIPNNDKIRIIERITKGQLEEYVDQILSKKSFPKDILDPTDLEETEESNPILDRKIKHLMSLSDKDKNYIINRLK